jgi:hypothetical protein
VDHQGGVDQLDMGHFRWVFDSNYPESAKSISAKKDENMTSPGWTKVRDSECILGISRINFNSSP